MSVVAQHTAVKHFSLPFDEDEVEKWASEQASCLRGPVTFGLVFCGAEALPDIAELIEVVRIYARVPVLLGCSSEALVADDREIENGVGFVVALYCLPDTRARTLHVPEGLFEDSSGAELTDLLRDGSQNASAWMLFAAPTGAVSESWLRNWDRATGGKVAVGGFASGLLNGEVSLFRDGETYHEGAVALSLEGRTTIEAVVSQACRPVGSPWTITRANQNVIHQVGNRPILEVLRDTLEEMSLDEQKMARGNIFIGLVMDEYKSTFGTGDFLVRNLAAIDLKTGAVAIASEPRVGQNLQFQIRDASIASIDFEEILRLKLREIGPRRIFGACLCDCIGRGHALFGVPDHDVSVVRSMLPHLPVGGLFCNGEFGPVKGRTMLHGYSAGLALMVER